MTCKHTSSMSSHESSVEAGSVDTSRDVTFWDRSVQNITSTTVSCQATKSSLYVSTTLQSNKWLCNRVMQRDCTAHYLTAVTAALQLVIQKLYMTKPTCKHQCLLGLRESRCVHVHILDLLNGVRLIHANFGNLRTAEHNTGHIVIVWHHIFAPAATYLPWHVVLTDTVNKLLVHCSHLGRTVQQDCSCLCQQSVLTTGFKL